MSIVCGTDFSRNARQASEVAAALAERMASRWPVDVLPIGPEKHAPYEELGHCLQDEARRLADRFR